MHVCVCVHWCVSVCVFNACEESRLLLPVGEDYAQCHGKLGEILNEAPVIHCPSGPPVFPLHIVTMDRQKLSYSDRHKHMKEHDCTAKKK